MFITVQEMRKVTPFGTFERTYDKEDELQNIKWGYTEEEILEHNFDITFIPNNPDLPKLRKFNRHHHWKVDRFVTEDMLLACQKSFNLLKEAFTYVNAIV
ncbi:MAG: hypothetical protein M0P69_04470 [Bacteroidales bacterium]|nr:hypothetical protein [Bacteroidales bacterium]